MTTTTAKTTTTLAPGAVSHGSKLMIGLLALWGLSVAFGVCMSTTVLAQDREVRASEPQSIGELQRFLPVTVEGTVVAVIDNTFVLEDSTGRLIVDTAPDWYMSIPVEAGDAITVVGGVQRRQDGQLEMDAYRIRTDSGEVITIREGPGRPPWAGGPNRARQPDR